MINPRSGFVAVSIRQVFWWSLSRRDHSLRKKNSAVTRLKNTNAGLASFKSSIGGIRKAVGRWCGTVLSRVDQGGWGWIQNGPNGGQEGGARATSKAEKQGVRAPASIGSNSLTTAGCGLERMRAAGAIAGWMGSVAGMLQLSSRTELRRRLQRRGQWGGREVERHVQAGEERGRLFGFETDEGRGLRRNP